MTKEQLKGWAAVVVAIAGLVTAVGAAVRKPPEDAARAGYLELTKAILDTQAQAKQDHDDLVALHTFVDGYVASHSVVTVEAPAPDAGSSKAIIKSSVVFAAPPTVPPPPVAPFKPAVAPRSAREVYSSW